MRGSNLLGQTYGLLTVTAESQERQNRYVVWKCRCECGGEILVNSRRLKRGTVQNCGCIPKIAGRRDSMEDLTGRVFGKLTVLHRAEHKNDGDGLMCRWICRCECGAEKECYARDLKAGKIKSCGCSQYKEKKPVKDISNQRFGRLVALYPTAKRDRKLCVYWHCRCDCGTETDVTSEQLLSNKYKSCGCLKRENQEAIFHKLHVVDGTCVEWLEKRKHRKDNTSGFRGVTQRKNGKYCVTIGFKGQSYYLGVYTSFEEAVRVRKEAEESLHGSFIEAFYQWEKCANQDPEWAKANPFSYQPGWLPEPRNTIRAT